MEDMFSFAFSLLSVITNVPYLANITYPWLIFSMEVQKNVIYMGLSFANLIVHTVNPFSLTKVHLLSRSLSTSDYFEPLAVLMWAILKNL
jgi:hypothetical protein